MKIRLQTWKNKILGDNFDLTAIRLWPKLKLAEFETFIMCYLLRLLNFCRDIVDCWRCWLPRNTIDLKNSTQDDPIEFNGFLGCKVYFSPLSQTLPNKVNYPPIPKCWCTDISKQRHKGKQNKNFMGTKDF